MKPKWDQAFTTLLLVCAVITTAIVVHREFFPASPASALAERKPIYVSDWKSRLAHGIRFGSASAPVQLIEFADFECPFCAEFRKRVRSLRERYPTQVSFTYVHFPLAGHRFALPAARAAECAREQGRFEGMYDALFEEQDSFGLKPWVEYAANAGVPDLAAFDACVKRTGSVPAIEEGRQLGTKLDVRGTPTVIINGWILGHPPTPEELNQMVKSVMTGNGPISRIHGS